MLQFLRQVIGPFDYEETLQKMSGDDLQRTVEIVQSSWQKIVSNSA